MISLHFICNGCGLYMDTSRNTMHKVNADMTNYLLISSGFKLKEPIMELHFCSECFAKIKDSEIAVSQYGNSVDKLRKDIDEKDKEIKKITEEFNNYKYKIKQLIAGKI